MGYPMGSFEQRLLENDVEALGQVIRWIAVCLSSPRFWSLRQERSDLHQEVLARVIESLRKGRYDPSRDFHFYVGGIAKYTALQALARRAGQGSSGPDPKDSADGVDAEERLIESDLVRRVLDCASDDCRELMRAYFLEGRDYAELAAEQAVPVGTVKSRLFRCLVCAHEALFGRGLKGSREQDSRRRLGTPVAAGPQRHRLARVPGRGSGNGEGA